MTTFALPMALRMQLVREAQAAYPRECCGLIEGRRGAPHSATALHPARNLSGEPDRFEIDPADQFRVRRDCRARGTAVIGCYHSHPGGAPEPSPRDRGGAVEKGFVWLIAAIDGTACVKLAGFVFNSPEFEGIDVV